MQFDKLNSMVRALTVECEQLRMECTRLNNVVHQLEHRLATTAEQRRLERHQRHSIEQEHRDLLRCNEELRVVIDKLQSSHDNNNDLIHDHFVPSDTDESVFVMV